MSYGQYVYMLIYFSIDINALRAILLKSAIVNRCSQITFHIFPDYRQAGIINFPSIFNHKGTKIRYCPLRSPVFRLFFRKDAKKKALKESHKEKPIGYAHNFGFTLLGGCFSVFGGVCSLQLIHHETSRYRRGRIYWFQSGQGAESAWRDEYHRGRSSRRGRKIQESA